MFSSLRVQVILDSQETLPNLSQSGQLDSELQLRPSARDSQGTQVLNACISTSASLLYTSVIDMTMLANLLEC